MIARALLLALALFVLPVSWAESKLKVMTAKDPKEWMSVLQNFTQKTGIAVDVVVGKHEELVAKLEAGEKADVFITKDLVYLHDAVERGLYQPMQSPELESLANPVMIHPDKLWVGLSYRARVIMHDPERAPLPQLSTYEDLTDSKWAYRLCLRESNNSYNQGLVAGLVSVFGEEWARNVLRGWMNNLGDLAFAKHTRVFSADTKVIEAIDKGECDVGITNTYYLAALLKTKPHVKVRPFFPSQNTTGAMTNGAGVGVLKTASDVIHATLFIEHLLSVESQEAIVATSNEYPVNSAAKTTEVIRGFGEFKINNMPWAEAGKSVAKAKALMSEVGWP